MKYQDTKLYERLDRATESERHAYINNVIKVAFRLKGWDYELGRN